MIYTGLRLLLFVAALVVVLGVWWAVTGAGSVTETQVFVSIVVAFVLSGISSYVLLSPQRERLAQRVEARAGKATAKFEELRSKED